MDDGSVKIELKPVGGEWRFYLKTDGLEFDFTFVIHDSLTWAQPLSENRKQYFFTHKTLALPLTGTMKVNEQQIVCAQDCLLTQDSFRS